MSIREQYRSGTPEFNKLSLALFAAGLATYTSMYATQALLPGLSDAFGVHPATAALTVSFATGGVALTIIPASALSERFGRTRVMTTSALAAAIIGMLLPLSPNLTVLLVGRALQGLALAGVPAVAMAYLSEEVHRASIGSAMGRYVAGTTLGGLLGRLVPAGVLDLSTWRWALEAMGIVSALCVVVFARLLPASAYFRPQRIGVRTVLANLRNHLSRRALGALFALGFVLMGGFVSVYNFLGYRLMAPPFSFSAGVAGLVFLFYLVGTVTSTAAGRLSDQMGLALVLLISLGVTVLGLLLTLSNDVLLLMVGMALFTGGFFGAHSVASGWVGRLATDHRAEASALYLFAYYMGSSIAGALAGVAFAAGGWPATVSYVTALLAVAVILALAVRRWAHAEK